ncbi:hypothetical protein D9758_008719 [Tetrapyrgos nigripes]|uniref:Restriction of telomere capping protein 4 n=1 Tax=Tetrapyrgos nigripes TaxID=182062 RepID=A0A8H5D4U7_9AGAR|nr:hypothetical protein D9758_008719 [Tetrapyrgos nigripes]
MSMEVLRDNRNRRGYNMDSDPKSRLESRPQPSNFAEDLGSSFAPGNGKKKLSRTTSTSSSKSRAGRSKSKVIEVDESAGGSEDELDFLSQDDEKEEESRKQDAKKVKEQPEKLQVDRILYDAHPDFPKAKKYSSFPRISKYDSQGSSTGTSDSPSNALLKENSSKPLGTIRSRESSINRTTIPLSPKSSNTRPPPKSHSDLPSRDNEKTIKPPKPRPKPKVTEKPVSGSRLPIFDSRTAKAEKAAKASEKAHSGSTTKRKPKTNSRRTIQSSGESDSDVEITDAPKQKQDLVPEPFPLSPLQESPPVSESKTDFTNRGRAKPAPAPFPMLMDADDSFSTPRASTSGTKSKRSSDASPDGSDRKKKRRAHEGPPSSSFPEINDYPIFDEDEDELKSFCADPDSLCPYCDAPLPASPSPLLLHLLEQTALKSVRAPRPRNPKGRKAALGVFVSVCQRHRFETDILPQAEKKGWPKQIDWEKIEARVQKMRPDLHDLLHNAEVKTYEPDMYEDDDDDDDDEHLGLDKRVRDLSVFWQEAVKEVKEKGTRVAGGVKNLFATFEKMQLGYYGELGSVIIHHTLFEMFPPDLADDLSVDIAPLDLKTFIERVLAPEVSMRLIMEDKGLTGYSGMREAVKILRESSAYGVAMFPEDGGEWGDNSRKKKKTGKNDDHMSITDHLIREKARKRRAELVVEDKVEKILLEEQLTEEREKQKGREGKGNEDARTENRKGKESEKGKGKGKGKVIDLEGDTSAAESASEKPRPRPRPKPRAITKTSTTSLPDEEMQNAMSDVEPRRSLYPSASATFDDTEPEEAGPSAGSGGGVGDDDDDYYTSNDMDLAALDNIDSILDCFDIQDTKKASASTSKLRDYGPLDNTRSNSVGSPLSSDVESTTSKRFKRKSAKTDYKTKTTSSSSKPTSKSRNHSPSLYDAISDTGADIGMLSVHADVDDKDNAMDFSSDSDVSIKAVVSVKDQSIGKRSTRKKVEREASVLSVEEVDPPPSMTTSRPRPRPKPRAAAAAASTGGSVDIDDDDDEATPKASKSRSFKDTTMDERVSPSSLPPLERARQKRLKQELSMTKEEKNKVKANSSSKKDDGWLKSMRGGTGSSRFSIGETDEELAQRMVPTSPAGSDSGWLLDDESQESIGNTNGSGNGVRKTVSRRGY